MLSSVLLVPLLASGPLDVALCVDANPLSHATAEAIAARVTFARIRPTERCPAYGFRARIVDGSRGPELMLQTPDGRRIRRHLPWQEDAEDVLARSMTSKRLSLLAGRLAGVIAQATYDAPPGPLITDAPPARPAPQVAPKPRRRRARPRPARPRAPKTAPPPPTPVPVSIATDPPRPPPPPEPPPLAVARREPRARLVRTIPVTPTPVVRRGVEWRAAIDLGARARGGAGVAPDTALRLGAGGLSVEVNWQPEADLVTGARPLRVQGVALGAGLAWPALVSDRWRVTLPLTLMAERMVIQRLDVASAAHVLWQGGARAGMRLAWGVSKGWFVEAGIDGRLMPLGGLVIADGPALDFNQLSARAGVGLLFVSD